MARVFISFDYQDKDAKYAVSNWVRQKIGMDISFTSEDGHNYIAKGEKYVRKILREKINLSHVVLVLVGQNTHNRPWVDYEIHHAKCHGKTVIWTQIPNTSGAPPKEISKAQGLPFDMKIIRNAIRGAMNIQ